MGRLLKKDSDLSAAHSSVGMSEVAPPASWTLNLSERIFAHKYNNISSEGSESLNLPLGMIEAACGPCIGVYFGWPEVGGQGDHPGWLEWERSEPKVIIEHGLKLGPSFEAGE